MDKLDLKTPDFTDENIQKLSELFPSCVTESADGKSIDFDFLKQELSSNIIEGNKERYQLTWPGKAESLVTANIPINKTLRSDREESIDFDNTENLFIEGDNLDALKLLQETYLGKIKMIYIDPPYNTGSDFVYKDNFSQKKAEYDKETGNKDEEGGRLVSNPDSNGRYHSDWLSMIYPRLKLARNLLRDDGVIFISIDDYEVENLKKVCDEIFGGSNFIETFIWQKKTPPNNVVVGSVHEYILMYAKNKDKMELYLLPRDEKKDKDYKNPDNDPRGRWKPDNLTAAAKGGRSTPSLIYTLVNPHTGQEHNPPEGRMWAVPIDAMTKKMEEGTVYWGKNGNGRPMDKRFLNQTRDGMVASTLLNDVGSNTSASKQLSKIFDGQVLFETPKPIELIQRFIQISLKEKQIALDFFAGSGVTQHAIFEMNIDNKERKCISVQIPEETDEKSEAFKAGYKTVAEIGKERIRRAGKKIKVDKADKDGIDELDVGFRVLKVDSSNMKDVYYTPDGTSQSDILDLANNIKDDRTDEDLLFQVLLDWGIDLSVKIEDKEIAGRAVYFADDDYLAACFERGLDERFVKELIKCAPRKVVLRDSGFNSSSIKINVEQLFKQANIEVKVI